MVLSSEIIVPVGRPRKRPRVTAGVSPSPVAGGYLPKVSACWKAILIVASWRVSIRDPESKARSRIT